MANNPPSHKLSLLKKIVLNQKIEPGSEGPPAKGSLIAIEDGKDYPKSLTSKLALAVEPPWGYSLGNFLPK